MRKMACTKYQNKYVSVYFARRLAQVIIVDASRQSEYIRFVFV